MLVVFPTEMLAVSLPRFAAHISSDLCVPHRLPNLGPPLLFLFLFLDSLTLSPFIFFSVFFPPIHFCRSGSMFSICPPSLYSDPIHGSPPISQRTCFPPFTLDSTNWGP